MQRWLPTTRISLRAFLVVTTAVGVLLGITVDFLLRPTRLPPQQLIGPIRQPGELLVSQPPLEGRIRQKVARLVPITQRAVVTASLVEESVDPTRSYPMIGSATQHHAIYHCTIADGWHHYTLTIDLNHLQMIDD